MKREYKNQSDGEVVYFTGTEIEHTAAYGKRTLFVVGLQDPDAVLTKAKDTKVEHIYLGANKSFVQVGDWETIIDRLLHEGYWVTLDYPIRLHNTVMRLAGNHMRNSRFIPMISVEIPNIELYNYNTVLKIDDIGMDETNPGVWCHYLTDLLDRERFTGWDKYREDEAL